MIMGESIAEVVGQAQYELPHRDEGDDMVRQLCRQAVHAPAATTGAEAAPFAAQGDHTALTRRLWLTRNDMRSRVRKVSRGGSGTLADAGWLTSRVRYSSR